MAAACFYVEITNHSLVVLASQIRAFVLERIIGFLGAKQPLQTAFSVVRLYVHLSRLVIKLLLVFILMCTSDPTSESGPETIFFPIQLFKIRIIYKTEQRYFD